MKLDELRQRLRRAARPKPKPKPAQKGPKKKTRLRCNKCRGPRVPAKLTDRDVAEIIREHPSVGLPPTAAFRCRPCGIIWLVGPIEPMPLPPTHHRCRSS